jgi:polyhydroxyalkanoate synthesis regulator phasin
MMDATQILADRIQHEIDMDILREIGEKVAADLTKEIELAEQKFNNKIERVIKDMTNDNIHKTNE